MDAKKTIKKYICPGTWMAVTGWVLAAVLVLCLVMGLAALNTDTGEVLEFYPDESPKGTMAYIDVVGVSNWLFKADEMTYYTVEDAEGYLYTVRLSDTQYDAMTAQQDYWNRETEDAPMPEAYHLVGYVQDVTSVMRENLSNSWGISEDEYAQYFGARFLNATTSTNEENSALWFMGALFSGLFALLCLIFCLRAGSNSKKCLAHLEQRGLLEKAAQQLEFTENHTVIGKKRGILTQDFLFGKGTGVAVAYDDIVWAYQQDQRRNFVVASSYLMIATRFMSAQGAIDLNRADRKGFIGDALAIISQRNPKTLMGFTNENRKAYKVIAKGE